MSGKARPRLISAGQARLRLTPARQAVEIKRKIKINKGEEGGGVFGGLGVLHCYNYAYPVACQNGRTPLRGAAWVHIESVYDTTYSAGS